MSEMIQIVKVDDSLMKKAEMLVSNVFPSRNLKEIILGI